MKALLIAIVDDNDSFRGAATSFVQSLGYTVEIAAPDEPHNTHADLEINLERCPAGAGSLKRGLTLAVASCRHRYVKK